MINILFVYFGYFFLWGRGKWGVVGIGVYLFFLFIGWVFNLINIVNWSSFERDVRCYYFDYLYIIFVYFGGYVLVYFYGFIYN